MWFTLRVLKLHKKTTVEVKVILFLYCISLDRNILIFRRACEKDLVLKKVLYILPKECDEILTLQMILEITSSTTEIKTGVYERSNVNKF